MRHRMLSSLVFDHESNILNRSRAMRSAALFAPPRRSFKAKVASIAKNKQLKLITGHDMKNSKCGDVYRTLIRHALFLLRFVYKPVIIFKRTNFQLYTGNRCNRPFFCLFRRISCLLQKLRMKDPGALIGYVMVQIMQGNTLFLCII